jgi:hypothetical protein
VPQSAVRRLMEGEGSLLAGSYEMLSSAAGGSEEVCVRVCVYVGVRRLRCWAGGASAVPCPYASRTVWPDPT